MTISGILLEVNDYGLEFDSFLGAVYMFYTKFYR